MVNGVRFRTHEGSLTFDCRSRAEANRVRRALEVYAATHPKAQEGEIREFVVHAKRQPGKGAREIVAAFRRG
jgi:hypothetical protein